MALANGAYPFTLTATQANGTSYTLASDLVIGDDVIVVLGTVNPSVTLNQIAQDIFTYVSPTTTYSSAEALTFSVEADKTITFNPATHTTNAGNLSLLNFGAEANILSATPIRVGESFTVTTDGIPDLTTITIAATFGGISLGSGTNITATTVDFTAPLFGLQLGANHELIVGIV